MLDVGRLRQELVDSGKCTPERLADAERAAQDQHQTLTEVLIARLMISFADLGGACARVTGLPYEPLANAPLPAAGPDAGWMSPAFAALADVFPVAYDAPQHSLRVAVQDRDQAAGLQRMLRFLMQDPRLEFTVAPDVEIRRAHERLRGGGRPSRESTRSFAQTHRWGEGKPVKNAVVRQIPKMEAPAPAPVASRDKEKRGGGGEPAYADMSQALIGAVTLLVRQQFADEPERVHAIRSCVRYGQLLASRLKFSPAQTDALVLASWLAALPGAESLVAQWVTPYRLDEVLFPDKQRGARAANPRPEGTVLKLIRCYQELKATQPDVCRNVNLTRRELFGRWSAAPEHQSILETFLQVLVDEEFLDRLGRTAGRILIVDPEEVALCTLAPPLISMGYDVIALPDTRAARELLDEFKPDLILVSAAPALDRAVWFCERLKGDARTASIPILALVAADQPQAVVRCLRAGANDYVTRPVHAELLFLKVQAHLSAAGVEVKECGVSGSLEEMSFTDMIQILSAGRRSVDLFLNNDQHEGRVYVREGDVVHAALGDQVGEPAFYALMRWKSGTFTTRQCGALPERSIHQSTMSLLMEGSRQVDEAPGGG